MVASTLEEGDRVLVRNVRLRGNQKLSDKWEQDVHVVIRKVQDLPVYTVQPEGKRGPFHTLHRDLLLPCGFLQPRESESPPKQRVVRRPRTRASPNDEGLQESESVSECSESADEQIFCCVPGRTLGSETQIITGHLPREGEVDSFVLDPAEENWLVQETVESNPEEPAKECLPEWKPVEENLDESVGMETGEDEPESQCTAPDVFVTQRPEPKSSHEPLSEFPTRIAETAPINSESRIEDDNIVTNEMSHTENTLSEDRGTEIEDSVAPRRSQRERRPPKTFEYPQLGNPLTLVIQSLLQGLNKAFSSSLEESVIAPVLYV